MPEGWGEPDGAGYGGRATGRTGRPLGCTPVLLGKQSAASERLCPPSPLAPRLQETWSVQPTGPGLTLLWRRSGWEGKRGRVVLTWPGHTQFLDPGRLI